VCSGCDGRPLVCGWHLYLIDHDHFDRPGLVFLAKPVSPTRQYMLTGVLDISVSLYQAKIVRTTVTLDDDVYEAVMHLSRASGERLGKVLSTLARRGLNPVEVPARRSSRRFPVFDLPANAPVIPASRIQRVIDEEGLF
jgi:hypothetical protein